jgi:cobalt-zinc-cadmium efflux system outer membrane protein
MFALALAVIAGCAEPKANDGFDDVHQLIQTRSGENLERPDEAKTAIDELLKGELSLPHAVRIALLNNQNLRADLEDLGIGAADVKAAGLLKNPVFAGSFRVPNQPPNGTDAELSIDQDFLDLLVLPLRRRMAATEFERTKYLVADRVWQLIVDVKSAYYTVVASRQLLEQLGVIANTNQLAADLAQRQVQAGTLNELGFIGRQSALLQSRIELEQSEADVRIERERLARLLGLNGDQTDFKVPARLPDLPAREVPVAGLESLALSQRLDLSAARAKVTALGEALRITKGFRFFTDVQIGVDTERTPDGQRVTGPTLALEIPIFDQGQARIAKLAAQYRQARDDYKAMAIDACSQVRASRAQMLAQRALADDYARLLQMHSRELELGLLQYNGMLKGTYDVLAARQALANSARGASESERDYWLARTELERAVGGSLQGDKQ